MVDRIWRCRCHINDEIDYTTCFHSNFSSVFLFLLAGFLGNGVEDEDSLGILCVLRLTIGVFTISVVRDILFRK